MVELWLGWGFDKNKDYIENEHDLKTPNLPKPYTCKVHNAGLHMALDIIRFAVFFIKIKICGWVG